MGTSTGAGAAQTIKGIVVTGHELGVILSEMESHGRVLSSAVSGSDLYFTKYLLAQIGDPGSRMPGEEAGRSFRKLLPWSW